MSAWLINPPSSGTLAFSLRHATYCRSCPCDRHDLYLPSIPASLQTLGRCECVTACAIAPLGLRIVSPLTLYLSFLGVIWTYDKNLAPLFPSHLSTVTPQIFPDPRPHSQHKYICRYRFFFLSIYIYVYTCIHVFINIHIAHHLVLEFARL